MSTSRAARSRNPPPEEAKENDFGIAGNSGPFPPPRTPLNAITDPVQKAQESETTRSGRASDRKLEAGAAHSATPRALTRHGKAGQSEPNSANSTPARTASSRLSLGASSAAAAAAAAAVRNAQFGRGREGSFCSSKVPRAISLASYDCGQNVAHFELEEDPSFWDDHNVQVLIRIRPLNSMERVWQGQDRCLRQESAHTLTWLGHPETRFTFDHVASETITQEKLFTVAGLPMVENCMSGYNSCMFAYGQTGSGKTYTMMGEINHMDGMLGEDCGITPRIFEYLFSRIRMEEEGRSDEKLKFSCKCSFLELYNEQITDLLEPSSTNLQLREDSNKGVYVENLTEYDVRTANDVIKLLLQGAANRKIAATYMNSESSRSHSVFTCVIESWWEKDSMSHFRFARLNLVDLAGSERQKSSGAEGERLKEAANINKSLSTLGLVIMSLVDLAHGKHRHVPYRDSRLTFLLQDSLGGNSKTTIIANVSPSICSAHETLSTLKFAQRAKLIQNNAKVNEDATGDVRALQRQIQQLKDQLSFLMEHYSLTWPLFAGTSNLDRSRLVDCFESGYIEEGSAADEHKIPCVETKKFRWNLRKQLLLRRENTAEVSLWKFDVEIRHVNRFACQMEEDVQRAKVMLRLREDKIKQLELMLDGSLPVDHYLIVENKALKIEIQLLQAKIDKNPEWARVASENLRLLKQLQLFQNFDEQGEREKSLAEISELRDQLSEAIKQKLIFFPGHETQGDDNTEELEDLREKNSKLLREIDELRRESTACSTCGRAAFYCLTDSFTEDHEETRLRDKIPTVEMVSTGSDLEDKSASYSYAGNVLVQNKSNKNEENHMHLKMLRNKNKKEKQSAKLQSNCLELRNLKDQNSASEMDYEDMGSQALQAKLDKLIDDLREARLLNCQYQKDHESQLSQQHQVDVVREQVETETARAILHLQEEVTALQLEFDDKICNMTQENSRLQNTLMAKEKETRMLSEKWESGTLELTNFLLEGSKSLKDAYGQIGSIVSLFPEVNVSISEQVDRAARGCLEKEETMLQLEASLQDAQKNVVEMELKLNSLREATLALNEFGGLVEEKNAEDTVQLSILLNEKINMISMLERKLELKEDLINKAEKHADAALKVKRLFDCHKTGHNNDDEKAIHILKVPSPTNVHNCQRSEIKTDSAALAVEEANGHIQFDNLYFESEKSITTFWMDMEVLISDIHMDIHQATSAYMMSIQEMVKEIREIRSRYIDIKKNHMGFLSYVKLRALETVKSLNIDNQLLALCPIRDELAKMTERLDLINDYINGRKCTHGCLLNDDNLVEANGWSADHSTSSCSTLGYDSPIESFVSVVGSESEESTKDMNVSYQDAAMNLTKEVDMVYDSFSNIYFPLIKILGGKSMVACSTFEEMLPSSGLRMETAGSCPNTQKVVAAKNVNPASTFLSKFEEAQAAMTEADYMLNALLKANENAKQLNGLWRQANEQLMEERSRLLEENERLRSSICLKEMENKLLLDENRHCLSELVHSVSLLEGCFVQMQREVEDRHKRLYSDILSIGREMLNFILSSRSSLESTFLEILKKGFERHVLYQCLMGLVVDKLPSLASRHQECDVLMNTLPNDCLGDQDVIIFRSRGSMELVQQSDRAANLMDKELVSLHNNLKCENISLKRELERKEFLLKGLLFDFSLLQETASSKKDIKDETETLILTLNEVRHELDMKTSQLDDILVKCRNLENHQMDAENALLMSISDLEQAKETIDTLSDQNTELKMLLKDLYIRKSEAEEVVAEQNEVVKSLENEIILLNNSSERKLSSTVEGLEEDLHEVTNERDQLREGISSLTDKLEMAYALADENEAVAIEARQESESSQIYAEQKEEEVKILEHSIEELERTINVLEKKVCEMDEEMKRHRLIRDSLELELQALRQRLSTVETFTDIVDPDSINATKNEYHLSRQLCSRLKELNGAHNQIWLLEKDIEEKDKEVKQLKEYVSELVLHSEAQASKYQEKYKTLEAMVHEVKKSSASTVPVSDTSERSSIRTRGSNSPFRCIAGLVQQMNLDNEKELSGARLRIDELEALLASRQKEICMLNARLAAAESMTHDVIRDLLGVKLDMTNYANLIDQHQVQKLVEEAQQQTEEFRAKEQEIFNLKKHIDDVTEERERCNSEMNKKAADMLVAQMTVEQLQERDQLLAAQNEMLKVDKSNLLKRVAELDVIVKNLLGSQSSRTQIQRRMSNTKENSLRFGDGGLAKRPQYSEKLLSRVDELATYHKPGPGHPNA